MNPCCFASSSALDWNLDLRPEEEATLAEAGDTDSLLVSGDAPSGFVESGSIVISGSIRRGGVAFAAEPTENTL